MKHDDTLDRLREGKRQLREARQAMTLPEKVREVVRLQAAVLPMIRRQRPLTEIERVWRIRAR